MSTSKNRCAYIGDWEKKLNMKRTGPSLRSNLAGRSAFSKRRHIYAVLRDRTVTKILDYRVLTSRVAIDPCTEQDVNVP